MAVADKPERSLRDRGGIGEAPVFVARGGKPASLKRAKPSWRSFRSQDNSRLAADFSNPPKLSVVILQCLSCRCHADRSPFLPMPA